MTLLLVWESTTPLLDDSRSVLVRNDMTTNLVSLVEVCTAQPSADHFRKLYIFIPSFRNTKLHKLYIHIFSNPWHRACGYSPTQFLSTPSCCWLLMATAKFDLLSRSRLVLPSSEYFHSSLGVFRRNYTKQHIYIIFIFRHHDTHTHIHTTISVCHLFLSHIPARLFIRS